MGSRMVLLSKLYIWWYEYCSFKESVWYGEGSGVMGESGAVNPVKCSDCCVRWLHPCSSSRSCSWMYLFVCPNCIGDVGVGAWFGHIMVLCVYVASLSCDSSCSGVSSGINAGTAQQTDDFEDDAGWGVFVGVVVGVIPVVLFIDKGGVVFAHVVFLVRTKTRPHSPDRFLRLLVSSWLHKCGST